MEMLEKIKISKKGLEKLLSYAELCMPYEVYVYPLHNNNFGGDLYVINDFEIVPQIAKRGTVDFNFEKANHQVVWDKIKEKGYILGWAHSHGEHFVFHSEKDNKNLRNILELMVQDDSVNMMCNKNSKRSEFPPELNLKLFDKKTGKSYILNSEQIIESIELLYQISSVADVDAPSKIYPHYKRFMNKINTQIEKEGLENVLIDLFENFMPPTGKYNRIKRLISGESKENSNASVYFLEDEKKFFAYSIVVNGANKIKGYILTTDDLKGKLNYPAPREVPVEIVEIQNDNTFDIDELKEEIEKNVTFGSEFYGRFD